MANRALLPKPVFKCKNAAAKSSQGKQATGMLCGMLSVSHEDWDNI